MAIRTLPAAAEPIKIEQAPKGRPLNDLIEEGYVDATLGTSLP